MRQILRPRSHMYRIAALAAVALALTVAPAASAGVTCGTDASAAIAAANVNGPRAGWDPPVWTFDMPALNMSVDVQAYDQPTAAAKAQTWLQGQVDAACAAANPAPAAPAAPNTGSTSAPTTQAAPTTDQTAAAQTLVAAAPVTYVGNSWGPIPLWRVNLPSLNLSIDVAAIDADGARQAVVALVAARLAQDNPAPNVTPDVTAPVTAPAAQVAPTVTVAPVTAPGVTTVPIEVARLLTPTLDPGIRSMLLATTG